MTSKLVEVVYSKRNRYEVRRTETFLGHEFWIYLDGKPHRGTFSSLPAALACAQKLP